MQLVARGWLVYIMTYSPFALSMVTAFWGLPIIFLSYLGGGIADRLPKRTLLILTETSFWLISLIIAILITINAIEIWHLASAALLKGIVFALNSPARQSFIPQLIQEKELTNAFALNYAGMNLVRLITPALAGFLLAYIGVDGVYFITVALLAMSVFFITMIRIPGKTIGAGGSPIMSDLTRGLVYIQRTSPLPQLLLLNTAMTLFAMPYIFLLPVFAIDVHKVGEIGLGWMMTFAGGGAVFGSLFIASLGDFPKRGMLLLISAFLCGLALVLFSHSTSFLLSLFFLALVGMGSTGFFSLNQSLLMNYTLAEMRGRVSSLSVLVFGFAPLGMLPIGALAEVWGAPLTIGGGGIIIIASSLLAFTTQIKGLR